MVSRAFPSQAVSWWHGLYGPYSAYTTVYARDVQPLSTMVDKAPCVFWRCPLPRFTRLELYSRPSWLGGWRSPCGAAKMSTSYALRSRGSALTSFSSSLVWYSDEHDQAKWSKDQKKWSKDQEEWLGRNSGSRKGFRNGNAVRRKGDCRPAQIVSSLPDARVLPKGASRTVRRTIILNSKGPGSARGSRGRGASN